MSNQIRYISTNEKFHAEKPRPNILFEFLCWKPPTVFPMACRGPTFNVATPRRPAVTREHPVAVESTATVGALGAAPPLSGGTVGRVKSKFAEPNTQCVCPGLVVGLVLPGRRAPGE